MLGLACYPRRRHLRLPVRGEAFVIMPHGTSRCEVIDISLGGLLLATLGETLRCPGPAVVSHGSSYAAPCFRPATTSRSR